MVYRFDTLEENDINPVTGTAYDDAWVILRLTEDKSYETMAGGFEGSAYTIRISKLVHHDWRMAVGDFICFHENRKMNCILVMTEEEMKESERFCEGHRFDDTLLRPCEPNVLIHSTTLENWEKIQSDGCLKSWNCLKRESNMHEDAPIGSVLGDPKDFRNFIMFGSGTACEIVVNSKQSGRVVMDAQAEYLTGARLYFDAVKMAADGLLLRDGAHLKVETKLPLKPYLLFSATWENVGLPSRISTPEIFAREADQCFLSDRCNRVE